MKTQKERNLLVAENLGFKHALLNVNRLKTWASETHQNAYNKGYVKGAAKRNKYKKKALTK